MPSEETACTCRHAPKGMIGWDRTMIARDCPKHGHEALPEPELPSLDLPGEQRTWDVTATVGAKVVAESEGEALQELCNRLAHGVPDSYEVRTVDAH